MRPGLKVLFITGHAENAVLSHGHLEPGMHVLTKPFAMEALASRIRTLIADKHAMAQQRKDCFTKLGHSESASWRHKSMPFTANSHSCNAGTMSLIRSDE